MQRLSNVIVISWRRQTNCNIKAMNQIICQNIHNMIIVYYQVSADLDLKNVSQCSS